MNVNAIDVLPGERVNFTAWCKPGQETGNSDHYTFTFNLGEGNTSEVNISKSEDPIKVHPDVEPQYIDLGEHTATVNVTDDPIEIASDSTIINVVEEYLGVEGTLTEWNYEEINEQLGDDGKLHGYFTVKNIAKENFSDYILNWTLNYTYGGGIVWGSNWSFEKKSGSLEPGESEPVNFSFTPPDTPGDRGATIWFNDSAQPDVVNDGSGIHINYGLVELFPEYHAYYYMEKGDNKTFDQAFWITSTRWETLKWELSDVTFNTKHGDPSNINYGFVPTSGIITPEDSYIGVDLWVNASDEDFTGCDIEVTVYRVDDLGVPDMADNDSVTIHVIAIDPLLLPGDYVSPDDHENTDWRRESMAYDALPRATWSVYKKSDDYWSDELILTLNSAITAKGFRIRARNEEKLDQMKIELYDGSNLVKACSFTDWPNRDWFCENFDGNEYVVNKVKIKFHENAQYTGFYLHRAFVYDFALKQELL